MILEVDQLNPVLQCVQNICEQPEALSIIYLHLGHILVVDKNYCASVISYCLQLWN